MMLIFFFGVDLFFKIFLSSTKLVHTSHLVVNSLENCLTCLHLLFSLVDQLIRVRGFSLIDSFHTFLFQTLRTGQERSCY